MNPLAFVLILAVLLAAVLAWAFRTLPAERWQILAALPRAREGPGAWSGLNLTWYGLLVASACTAASALFLLLMASSGDAPRLSLLLVVAIMVPALPAAKLIARAVEQRKHTITVAGAAFVGLLLTPAAVLLLEALPGTPPRPERLLLVLAAVCAAFALGEGLGRLACISFGCCYGKPLHTLGPLLRRLSGPVAFVFEGPTKKAVYASGLGGVPVLPVQAVTATVLVATSLAGTLLFLQGRVLASLLLAGLLSQGWRLLSETLRADHRGGGRLSAYQGMALLACGWIGLLAWLTPPGPAPRLNLAAGLAALWDPAVLLALQVLWVVVFLHTGRSMVTGSQLRFHVHADRI